MLSKRTGRTGEGGTVAITDSEIARTVGCDRKTVRSVKDGRTLRSIWTGGAVKRTRKRQKAEIRPKMVGQHVCVECSDVAGHEVRVIYEPCVACLARRHRQHSMLANTPAR